MKALKFLKELKESRDFDGNIEYKIDAAIKELEDIQSNINTSIEEIEYALAKPMYADVYLNNALRYLKGEQK